MKNLHLNRYRSVAKTFGDHHVNDQPAFTLNAGLPVGDLLEFASSLLEICYANHIDAAVALEGLPEEIDKTTFLHAHWMASYLTDMVKAMVDSAVSSVVAEAAA